MCRGLGRVLLIKFFQQFLNFFRFFSIFSVFFVFFDFFQFFLIFFHSISISLPKMQISIVAWITIRQKQRSKNPCVSIISWICIQRNRITWGFCIQLCQNSRNHWTPWSIRTKNCSTSPSSKRFSTIFRPSTRYICKCWIISVIYSQTGPKIASSGK